MTNDDARVVLVTGATGKQGGAVARALLTEDSFRVRALTRDPHSAAALILAELGAEVVRGDLDDRVTFDRALEGVHGVFSVQNFWETGYDREVEQGVRLADAALAAGVRHFVYSSVASAHRNTGLSHFESKWRIENHIRSLALPHTIVRPVFFMDNWESPAMGDPIVAGRLVFPLSADRTFQQVAVRDIGGIVALALRQPDAWLGRALDIAGDERTMREVANGFARVLGRAVDYVQVPWDDFRNAMGEEYYKMMRWFEEVGYDADVREVRRIYPKATGLEEYLKVAGWSSRRSVKSTAPASWSPGSH